MKKRSGIELFRADLVIIFFSFFQKGDATSFLPVFQSAREKGLKLSLHLAEVRTGNFRQEACTVPGA